MFFPAIKGSVAKFYKIKESQIDGPVFNVHCKITAILLFLGSTIITTQMNVGKPIQCISDVKNEDREKVINTFCWVNSTFRLVPDLSPYDDSGSYPRDHGPSRETYYNYYQWVGFILFFQAIIFYSPKWFWKLCEGKLMATLLATGSRKYEEGEARKKKAQSLTNYFTDRLKRHRSYAITYWLMEFLCLCNVILQTIMIDKFLGGNGQFLSYGSKFSFSKLNLAGTVETLNGGGIAMKKFNELDYIFPLQTKCNFRYFGASGSPQLVDALCILFLNIYNRCIFAIMWYWFSLLLLLLTSLLIYRLALIFSPPLRVLLLRTPGKRDLDRETKAIVNQLPVTDWWVLYMLKQNIDVNLFKDLISELFHDLQMSKKMRDSDE